MANKELVRDWSEPAISIQVRGKHLDHALNMERWDVAAKLALEQVQDMVMLLRWIIRRRDRACTNHKP
jgi:hypothetical protein